VGQERDFFPKDRLRDSLLGPLAVGLAFLRAVDAAEADTFSAVRVQDFNSVAVEDGDGRGGMVLGSAFAVNRFPLCHNFLIRQ
jgi:hypothetical protein